MLVPFGFRLILRLLRQQDGIADKACAAAHNEGSIGSVILVQALAREFRQQPSAALTADAQMPYHRGVRTGEISVLSILSTWDNFWEVRLFYSPEQFKCVSSGSARALGTPNDYRVRCAT